MKKERDDMVQRFFKILYYACRGRHLTEKAVIVLAKFGFVVYILYGVVTWLYPGRAAERFERRRAVAAAALSLGLTVVAAALLRKIYERQDGSLAPRKFAVLSEQSHDSCRRHRRGRYGV